MAQLPKYLLAAVFVMLADEHALRADEAAAQPDSLPKGAVAWLGESRFLNFGRVFSMAFSPDGKVLAGGAWDGSVRLWDVASGKELQRFQEKSAPVLTVAFSPDGKLFACDGKGSEISVRDAATCKELRRLAGQRGAVTFVAFSPDGKTLASNGHDRTLRLWDVAGGRELRRFVSQDFPKHVSDPNCPITFSADGKTVASATMDAAGLGTSLLRTFHVWDVATGAEIRSFTDDSLWHGPVAFSPGSRLAAVASGVVRGQPPRINLWDLASGKALPAIELIPGQRMIILTSLVFSPDGKMLASSDGGPIQLWELATRRQAAQFPTPDNGTACLAFSPNGRLLATGSTDTTALLWDVSGRMQNGKLPQTNLSSQEFQALWDELGNRDASKARQALWAMVAAGNESVKFLRTRLHPVAIPTNAEAIDRLVGNLSSPEYAVRAGASAELVKLSELAEPALLRAQQNHPALELRRRVDELLKLIVDSRARPSGDRLRGSRVIEILEQLDTPPSRELLQTLSRGAASALLTQEAHAALARLERRANLSTAGR